MIVIEEEKSCASKLRLCDKLLSSLSLCDNMRDVNLWLIDTEDDRNEIRKDRSYFEYLKNEFEIYRTLIKLKQENPNVNSASHD